MLKLKTIPVQSNLYTSVYTDIICKQLLNGHKELLRDKNIKFRYMTYTYFIMVYIIYVYKFGCFVLF